jgi:DNA-binding response OmpR family regulator
MAAGATEALEKPCLPEELLAAVRKVLKARDAKNT